MRQAIGTTWLMQIVIIFMLIFVAFLALTINYTKAFKIKNELITMVEKYEGIGSGDKDAIGIINNYLTYNNYTVKGHCDPETEYGVENLSTNSINKATKDKKYFYCVQKIYTGTTSNPNRSKYNIRIFFHFSLPVIGDIFTFSVEGTTIDINQPIASDNDMY